MWNINIYKKNCWKKASIKYCHSGKAHQAERQVKLHKIQSLIHMNRIWIKAKTDSISTCIHSLIHKRENKGMEESYHNAGLLNLQPPCQSLWLPDWTSSGSGFYFLSLFKMVWNGFCPFRDGFFFCVFLSSRNQWCQNFYIQNGTRNLRGNFSNSLVTKFYWGTRRKFYIFLSYCFKEILQCYTSSIHLKITHLTKHSDPSWWHTEFLRGIGKAVVTVHNSKEVNRWMQHTRFSFQTCKPFIKANFSISIHITETR